MLAVYFFRDAVFGLGPVVRNLNKGLSRDMLVILAEFCLQSFVRKLDNFILVKFYHGDLFSAASLLQTRLNARFS